MGRDEGFLLDMLLAVRDARAFVSGLTRRQFDASRLHQNAVIKTLEIIGMRNRLVHGYFDVDWT